MLISVTRLFHHIECKLEKERKSSRINPFMHKPFDIFHELRQWGLKGPGQILYYILYMELYFNIPDTLGDVVVFIVIVFVGCRTHNVTHDTHACSVWIGLYVPLLDGFTN